MGLLGATPVSMPTENSYQAAQRGLVSAVMTGWSAVLPFKLQDVVQQHLNVALGHIVGLIMMNKGAYAALPEAARKAIDADSGESFSRRMGHTTDRMNALGGTVVCKQPGQTCYELSPEQAAEFEIEGLGEQYPFAALVISPAVPVTTMDLNYELVLRNP